MHHASLHIDTYCVIHACIYTYWRKIEVKRRKTIAVITMVAMLLPRNYTSVDHRASHFFYSICALYITELVVSAEKESFCCN